MPKDKIGQYGPYTIYLVNGENVRNSSLANEEFGEFAIHNVLPALIPEDEIWIEDDVPKDEWRFLIANALFQLKLLTGGMSKDDAYDKALEYESELRQNAGSRKKEAIDIRDKILFNYGRYTFWTVNGFVIRNRYKTDFVEGGNHARYSWIPDNELWIETLLHKDEYSFIAAHEFIEDMVMSHYSWPYDEAHKLASKVEYKLRDRKDVTLTNCIPLALQVLVSMKIPATVRR
jgi:hypothetical protein